MTVPAKGNRVYPYSQGLKVGVECDIVLANANSEPVNAHELIKGVLQTDKTGGDEVGEDEGLNTIKARNGMARIYTKTSYCRAYSVDNIWWSMKELVVALKKRAFLSYVPAIYGEDFEGLEDGMAWVAAGHLKLSSLKDIYADGSVTRIHTSIYDKEHESHARLKNNLRLTAGILSLLLDKRESAEYRRMEYGPFGEKEFRATENALVYQTPTNWWIFSPILAHLMLGCSRVAVFITLNKIEEEIWEGFEEGDVTNAIHHSSYETGREIWELMSGRLGDCGYRDGDNPFWQQRAKLLEFLFEYGVGAIGDGIYKNWRMARKRNNYHGHLADVPGWESGAFTKVFHDKHPKHKLLQSFLGG